VEANTLTLEQVIIDESFINKHDIAKELISQNDESSARLANGEVVRVHMTTRVIDVCFENYSTSAESIVMKLSDYQVILECLAHFSFQRILLLIDVIERIYSKREIFRSTK